MISLSKDAPTTEALLRANHVRETLQAILPNNYVAVRTGIMGSSDLFISLASCPPPAPNDVQRLAFYNARTTGIVRIDSVGIHFDITIKNPDGSRVRTRARKGDLDECLAYLVAFITKNPNGFAY